MPDTPIKRTRRRVIRRSDLPASKLATTRKPPKPKPKQNRKPLQRKAPSAIRADNLNASLNAFDSWRNYQPLALGIERQVFQYVAKCRLSCSKSVLKKLLRQHTRNTRYLGAVKSGQFRYNLDGTTAGAITPAEKEYAQRMLNP